MRLDLREVINIPGAQADFDFMPEMNDMEFEGISSVIEPFHAVGTVKNKAGVLELDALVTARFRCVCARCLTEFEHPFKLDVRAVLAEDVQDEYESDIYTLEGDYIDLDEVIITSIVLNIEQRYLCSEDCRGLCGRCGKNLNDGPCDCGVEKDPRLAVLEQLLENN
ncbi:MAG: DUF177 domain-containing protein [Oscillospiraceae bacterium]|nr:DUF177 domain-containing protein [Oscillospiraceae bacterium]